MPSIPRPHLPHHLSLQRLMPAALTSSERLATSPTRSNTISLPPSPTRSREAGAHEHRPTGLVLRVHVLKGRNLAPRHKSGTSDPFLVLTLGDCKEATPVAQRTLSPEWNSAFDLPIVGVESLLLEVQCFERDRFRKDYMGEFDVVLEDVFKDGHVKQEPKWYKLESRRSGKKSSIVSGEVLLQFHLHEPANTTATEQQILRKLSALIASELGQDYDDADRSDSTRVDTGNELDDTDGLDLTERRRTSRGPEAIEKRRKQKRLARLKRKTKLRAYQFGASSETAGVLFLEILKITDLPPERNAIRTGFDMDPFVVTSFGKKTCRTRVIRHNLNPIYDEKMVFQVLRHEANYSVTFSVVDRDFYSNNDFVGTATFPLETAKRSQPEPDTETGLYPCVDTPEMGSTSDAPRRSRFRMSMSRSSSTTNINRSHNSSSTNLNKLSRTSSSNSINAKYRRTAPHRDESTMTSHTMDTLEDTSLVPTTSNTPPGDSGPADAVTSNPFAHSFNEASDDPDLRYYTLPLLLKHKDRWEDKHKPVLHIRAKYLPYQALRQQFWRAMLKQYDADENGIIERVELTTMLDTLGSTLRESTIDAFFERFAQENGHNETLTMDQAVTCLEDRLHQDRRGLGVSPQDRVSSAASSVSITSHPNVQHSRRSSNSSTLLNNGSQTSFIPVIDVPELTAAGETGHTLPYNDLNGGARGEEEEHVVEIHECPICHQPRLNKKNTDADIITHIATCASQDWRAVNNLVMGGFVTSSQAQRKWYSKVITKIGYGGYRIGANSANILVQDRITGQINEERMSIYVRLGIRLLYKGLKSREMEKKKTRKLLKSLSIKQGRKYDDPASAAQIPTFIHFHRLDMSEVLLTTPEFKTFNEFFYRKLKPDARPCSAPERPEIVTSPADCRSVVFGRLEEAQRVWVKGREFSVERLLGNAYPEDAKLYKGGCAMGIFRLAPQDYHRFHIPVDGVMGEPKLIEGEYYTVNPMAIRSSLDVYGDNVRVVVPIDSVSHGRVMVICVGAMMVGSTIITRKAGEHVKRAEELGYFKFGGSTLLVLFEAGRMKFDQDLVDNSNGALETLLRVGMSIGHSPHHKPHLPDMRKENPSMEERQDAKRRIEGSFAPSGIGLPSAANMS